MGDTKLLINLNTFLLVVGGVLYAITGEILFALAMILSLGSIVYLTWIENDHT